MSHASPTLRNAWEVPVACGLVSALAFTLAIHGGPYADSLFPAVRATSETLALAYAAGVVVTLNLLMILGGMALVTCIGTALVLCGRAMDGWWADRSPTTGR